MSLSTSSATDSDSSAERINTVPPTKQTVVRRANCGKIQPPPSCSMSTDYVDVLFEALCLSNDVTMRSKKYTTSQPPLTTSNAVAATQVEETLLFNDQCAMLRMSVTNVPLDNQAIASAWLGLSTTLAAAIERQCGGQNKDNEGGDGAGSLNQRLHTIDGRVKQLLGGRGQSSAAVVSSSTSSSSYLNKSCYIQRQVHQILPGLFVGSYHPASDRTVLDEYRITHICCCVNVAPRFPEHYTYHVIAADDNNEYDMLQHFDAACDFIDGVLTHKANTGGACAVLVHCGAGISRAPTIAAAYLIRKVGLSAMQAVQLVKSVRSCASPNRGFMAQLERYAATISATANQQDM